MAIVRAVKSGNWSDPTVWNTGALPTASDDVYSNTFTVTIDISPTVLSIGNEANTGNSVSAGGFFVPNSGTALTCTAIQGIRPNNGVTSQPYRSSLGTSQSCSVIANIVGCGNNLGFNGGVVHSGSGTVNIVGNVTGGINANSTANNGAVGVLNSSSGVINITGDCYYGTENGCPSVVNNSSGIINITGNIYGGITGHTNVVNNSTGTLNITGVIIGSSVSSMGYGLVNNSSGSVIHTGTVLAQSQSSGIGIGSALQITILSGPLLTSETSINPCIAARWLPAETSLSTFKYEIPTDVVVGATRNKANFYFFNALTSNYPSESDVRKDVVYALGDELTGSMAVPPAESVIAGVPVDDEVGTMQIALSPEDIWNSAPPDPPVPGSVWEKISQFSTVESVGEQIAALGRG